jgi:LmbE family N-acetylglucosaminyl deacetylase
LLGYIRRLRPTVILTHDPYGGYGHPDHIRCCEAVTAAFHIARGEASQQQNGYAGPQKLYYTAFDQRILQLALAGFWLARKDATQFGRNKDINLVEIASWPKPVNATIHVGAYLQKKDLASRAHVSQYSGAGPGFLGFMPPALRQRFIDWDRFTRAFPPPGSQVEDDLFAGI